MPELNTSDAIDKVQSLFYDVDIDADNADLRLRILEWHQEVGDEVWNWRPWPFRIKTATVSIPNGENKAVLPDDFQEVGPHGSVYGPFFQGKAPMEERSVQEVRRFQQYRIGGRWPAIFAIFESEPTTTGDAAVDMIQLPQVGGGSGTNLTVTYEVTPPEFLDTIAPPHGYERFPVSYHYSTIFAGVKARAARGIGDARADMEFEPLYQRGLKRMTEILKGRRSSVRRLPKAIPPMYGLVLLAQGLIGGLV